MGEVITSVVAAIIVKYKIAERLGVYVANNAISNNVAYRVLIKVFHEGEREGAWRSHYLSHIINLAAQAFIYGRDNESFIAEINAIEAVSFKED